VRKERVAEETHNECTSAYEKLFILRASLNFLRGAALASISLGQSEEKGQKCMFNIRPQTGVMHFDVRHF
jgi:hypothetical protein